MSALVMLVKVLARGEPLRAPVHRAFRLRDVILLASTCLCPAAMLLVLATHDEAIGSNRRLFTEEVFSTCDLCILTLAAATLAILFLLG